MEKRLEATEEQFKKEKEENKLQFEKERKVGSSLAARGSMAVAVEYGQIHRVSTFRCTTFCMTPFSAAAGGDYN